MVSRRSWAWILLVALGSALGGASCPEPIAQTPCVETSFTVASASADTVTLSTGLRYVQADSEVGVGNPLPWCRTVIVHYTGYLLNGTEFDSSRNLAPLALTPGTGVVIDGFEQGVIGMHKCGLRRLIIPPNLAFGAEARRNAEGEIIIPANSTVVFDIEVLEIVGEIFVPCEEPSA
jgi:FKBP-type peptidyl-prolyl cis-trans isomerase